MVQGAVVGGEFGGRFRRWPPSGAAAPVEGRVRPGLIILVSAWWPRPVKCCCIMDTESGVPDETGLLKRRTKSRTALAVPSCHAGDEQ